MYDFEINFSIGRLVQKTKVITPPPVTVDPPLFVFKAEGSNNVSDIKGRLTIKGGDQYEDSGDRVIVHNQDANGDVGLLTNRTTDRMIQVGKTRTATRFSGLTRTRIIIPLKTGS